MSKMLQNIKFQEKIGKFREKIRKFQKKSEKFGKIRKNSEKFRHFREKSNKNANFFLGMLCYQKIWSLFSQRKQVVVLKFFIKTGWSL